MDLSLDDEMDTALDNAWAVVGAKIGAWVVERTRPRVDVLTVDVDQAKVGDLAISSMREHCSAEVMPQHQRATLTIFLSGYLIVGKIWRSVGPFLKRIDVLRRPCEPHDN